MSITLIYLFIIIALGFGLSRLALSFAHNGDDNGIYIFRRDPWLYLICLTIIGLVTIFLFTPQYNDMIISLNYWEILGSLSLAGLIYGVFLLENDKLFMITVIFASLVVVFFLPPNLLLFEGLLPWWADRLVAGMVITVFSFSALFLNGMAGIFGIQCLTITVGLTVIALFGGLPMLFVFWGGYLTGVWLGFFNLNFYPGVVYLNKGACVSAFFIFGWLLLRGATELAGPSMLILIAYPTAELLWVFSRRFIFNQHYPDWAENTSYVAVYQKGVSVAAINVAVAKISVVNIILACFQLYAPNAFSIPFFALLVDLWLLNLLYSAPDQENNLGDIHQRVLQDVTSELNEVKNALKKGKDKG